MGRVSVLADLARLALACVFVASAWGKVRDRSGSRGAVEAFGVPKPLIGPVTVALPVVELVCAALLLAPDPAATIGAVGSLLLLMAFTALIVANLARGRRPDCHCFGATERGHGITWWTVARNVGLLALVGLSLVGEGIVPSVPAGLGDLGVLGLVLLAVGAALLGALGAATRRARSRTRSGAAAPRVEALEHGRSARLRTLALTDLDGARVTLDDVVRGGRPSLVVFVGPTCRPCSDLLPALAAWQSDSLHPLEVVIVSDGSPEDNRRKTAGVGRLRVLLRDPSTTLADLGLAGTPAAVLIDTDERPGPPAYGADRVRELHDAAVETVGHHTDEPTSAAVRPPASAWTTPAVTTTATPAPATPVGAGTPVSAWNASVVARSSAARSTPDTSICPDSGGCVEG